MHAIYNQIVLMTHNKLGCNNCYIRIKLKYYNYGADNIWCKNGNIAKFYQNNSLERK